MWSISAKLALAVITTLTIVEMTNCQKSFDFQLKLTNVDSTSAKLEILDDNITAVIYTIKYVVTSNSTIKNGNLENTISTVNDNTLEVQTNPFGLMAQQDRILSSDGSADALIESARAKNDGVYFTEEQKEILRSRSYEEIHRFLVPDLEPNREYELSLSVHAKEARLSSIITGGKDTEGKPRELDKAFKFKFKTTYDYDLAAELACKNSQSDPNAQPGNPLYGSSSCYVDSSICNKCTKNCYEVKPSSNAQVKPVASGVVKKILCEACPCDTSRSTGECSVDDSDSEKAPITKCKQCIDPYVGSNCNECRNEGIDFYKSESGECRKCFCNNNAAFDVDPNGFKRRRCQAITGACIECMFNTGGDQCQKCSPGFSGDALKRTCVENRRNSSSNGNQIRIDPNEKYTYKTLALFSLYIFCILTLVLLTFMCIKSRYYNADHMLKNGPSMPQGSSSAMASFVANLNAMFASLDQSTRPLRTRIGVYFGTICPTTMRFVRVATNQPSSNGNGLNTNDDDRLNLAEYQMFDDSLLQTNSGADDGAFTYMDDGRGGDSRNPYRSLTIKT